MTSPSITLCLIVKDEEQFVETCIGSARGISDEVVVVDTGSTDRTLTIVSDLADTVEELPFDGDFSAARNRALDLCRGDWVVFLDADEVLEPDQADKLAEEIRAAAEGVLALCVQRFNFFANGQFYSGRQVRAMRRAEGLRYERRINESVKGSIARLGGRIHDVPVYLNHFGHTRSVTQRNQKALRYLEFMDHQLADQPGDAVVMGYKALILRTLGRFEEALDWMRKSLDQDPAHPVVQSFAGHVLRATGRLDDARAAFEQATALAPNDASAWNMVGVLCLSQGDPDRAESLFRHALEVEPLTYAAELNLGLAHESRECWRDAVAQFERLAVLNPGFLHDDWRGRLEIDPFRSFYNETIFGYAGLAKHLEHCRARLRPPERPVVPRATTTSPVTVAPELNAFGPNGGVLACLLAAAGEAAAAAPVRSLHTVFVSPATNDDASVDTEAVHTKGSQRTLRLQMTQGDSAVCVGLGRFGASREGSVLDTTFPPDAAEPSEYPSLMELMPAEFIPDIELYRRLALHPLEWEPTWPPPKPPPPRARYWCRAEDDQIPSLGRLWPAVAFDLLAFPIVTRTSVGAIQAFPRTTNLTIEAVDADPGEWVLVEARLRYVGGGSAIVEGAAWNQARDPLLLMTTTIRLLEGTR